MARDNWAAVAENLWKSRRQEATLWMPMAERLMNETALSTFEVKGYVALATSLVHQSKGDYEKAHEQAQVAIQYFEVSGLILWQARGYMIEGFLHVNQNLFKNALEDWKSAYDRGQIVGDREMVISSLYSIAILNRVNLQRYSDAIDYFTHVLKLCMETDPPYPLIGNVYSGLSKCHMAIDDKKTAENYAVLALDYAKRYGDKRTLGWSLELCVTTYIALDDLEKACQFSLENIEIWKVINDAYGLAIAYQDLATVFRLRGDLKEALHYGQIALEYALHMHSQLVLETLYKELATLAETLGDATKSLEYYKAYMIIREQSLKASFDREISQVAGELKLENYRLRHVELEEKMRALKEAQEALVRSEKMNALLGLVGGVAHEINTPLGNSMTLNSYVLAECEELLSKSAKNLVQESELLEYLDTAFQAQKGIEKGLNTVSRIVESFKRIAVNPNSIHKERVNTLEFLNDWKTGLKLFYPQYSAVIDIQCPTLHHCDIDVSETMKVLDELFLNTLKHAYKDFDIKKANSSTKQILLEVIPEASPQQEAPVKEGPQDTTSMTLKFTDYGCGIEGEWLARIFEPFVRIGSSSSDLGIGLHVIYNVVVYVLQGSIELTSEPGVGTTVTIRL